MATNPQQTVAVANAAADVVCALLNSGKLRIYTASQAATADTAVSGQTLLAELTFGSTAFGAASGGIATANAITADSDADATGTAAWFRCLKSDGTTVVFDGSVGTSSANLIVATTSIVQHGSVSVTSLTYEVKRSG